LKHFELVFFQLHMLQIFFESIAMWLNFMEESKTMFFLFEQRMLSPLCMALNHRASKTSHFLHSSVENWPILIIFGTQAQVG